MDFRIKKGMPIEQIDTPALILDLDVLQDNISRMAAFFADSPVRLRPHIKTHKCPEIARLQLDAGAAGITCAKVSEAEVFARAGIKDILIANQVTGKVKIDRLTELAGNCNLMVAVDDPINVARLNRRCREKGVNLGVLVEVDIGMNRCGVQPGQPTVELARDVDNSAHLSFRGLQAYEGHLVLMKDPAERSTAVRKAFEPLEKTCRLLEKEGLKPEIVSGGGTGTYDISGTETPLTEIQAGSYVFMDETYLKVRSEFKSSLNVLSSVVSRPVPERLVTDAGLKSMTSEFGWPRMLGGMAVEMNYLSEEHGVLTLLQPGEVELQGGDRVRFLPSHVCTTVNLHDQFYVYREGLLVDIWKIAARGCAQ